MIKLTRLPPPSFLSDQKAAELTQEYKLTGKSVWNNDYIKKTLLESSNYKCAYCECPLASDSNYMEVEHYEDKKANPDKVVLWDNLLPSCKKCNGAKSGHDTSTEPIVNPYLDNPKQHFALRLYRLRGKSAKGMLTIEVTNLNHSTRLVLGRFWIGQKLAELVETAQERLNAWQANRGTRTKNRVIGTVEGLLQECTPHAAYAASAATVLLTDPKFARLVQVMRAENLWNAELEALHSAASSIVLEVT